LSRSQSWKSWGAIIAILVVSGLVAAAWPFISGQLGGSGASVPVTSETITIPIPALPIPIPFLEGITEIVLPSWLAMAIIAMLVIGGVVVMGIVTGFLYRWLSRLTQRVVESESFQQENQVLTSRTTEKLAARRSGRKAALAQQNDYSRWSVIATSLAILLFAFFAGLLVATSLFPTGEVTVNGQPVNVTVLITGAFLLLTLLYLILRMSWGRLNRFEGTDRGIPWDTIAVVLTGFLIVVVGIGLIVYLNVP
jgi:hypothetical protein